MRGDRQGRGSGVSHSSVVLYWCVVVGGLAEVELSTPGLVTDGVGKISSSLRSPVGPSQESLCPSSLFPPSFFPVVSHSFVFACASYLLCFDSVVGSSEISSPLRSCVFVQTGKEDDISRIVSRLMQYFRESNGKKPTEKRTKKMM